MAEIRTWLKKEFRDILPVWAFFFFSFSLIAITFSAVLREYHVESFEPPAFFVGSLLVAKAVLIVDGVYKRQGFPRQPLIYKTLWTAALYFVVTLIVRHVEEVLKLVWRHHIRLIAANRQVLHTSADPRYWATLAWFAVLIFAFCTVRELVRLIGRDRFMYVFFGRNPSGSAGTETDSRAA